MTILLLAGCERCTTPTKSYTFPTTADIFVTPEESQPEECLQEATHSNGRDLGSISHGFPDKSLRNERGLYCVYRGDELRVRYGITATGFISEGGIGVFLLLDGQPQPYCTTENDEVRYMHIFDFSESTRMETDLIFTPITGGVGDTLELTAAYVPYPNYYPSEKILGLMQTNGSSYSSIQVVFQAPPPETDPLPVTERVLAQSVEMVELTSEEIMGASSQSLQESVTFRYSSDHPTLSGNIYGITKDKPLILTGEIFGAPAVEWSLIVYVDHQPVSVIPENRIVFHTENGKKTVVTMTLDMSDFDGEGIVYGVLCARNWRDPAVLNNTNCGTEITPTYYLTDAASFEAMGEKYGWQN